MAGGKYAGVVYTVLVGSHISLHQIGDTGGSPLGGAWSLAHIKPPLGIFETTVYIRLNQLPV